MTDPARYAHHHARTMRLVEEVNRCCAESHRLKLACGYYETLKDDPAARKLEQRADRLFRIIDRSNAKRERYASSERWTPYRAWPY